MPRRITSTPRSEAGSETPPPDSVQAFLEEFSADDSVSLVLRVSSDASNKRDLASFITRHLCKVSAELSATSATEGAHPSCHNSASARRSGHSTRRLKLHPRGRNPFPQTRCRLPSRSDFR